MDYHATYWYLNDNLYADICSGSSSDEDSATDGAGLFAPKVNPLTPDIWHRGFLI